jgi:hypothetical protein
VGYKAKAGIAALMFVYPNLMALAATANHMIIEIMLAGRRQWKAPILAPMAAHLMRALAQ